MTRLTASRLIQNYDRTNYDAALAITGAKKSLSREVLSRIRF